MEIYVKKIILFPYFLFFSGFQTWFYQTHWFNPHRSFKRSKRWRQQLAF